MHISGKFDQKTIKYHVDPKHLPLLHGKHNKEFELPQEIRKSSQPSKMLNAKLINDDIFSFSFVRHPYTRYLLIYLIKLLYSYKSNLLLILN